MLRDRLAELLGVARQIGRLDLFLLLGTPHVHAEQLRHDVGRYACDHVDEEVVALLLVLLLRILLPVAAQPDAVAR